MATNDSKTEVTEKAKEAAAEMARAYEDRPTVVLPGSHGTVSGTAVNDWLDEDGNPIRDGTLTAPFTLLLPRAAESGPVISGARAIDDLPSAA